MAAFNMPQLVFSFHLMSLQYVVVDAVVTVMLFSHLVKSQTTSSHWHRHVSKPPVISNSKLHFVLKVIQYQQIVCIVYP